LDSLPTIQERHPSCRERGRKRKKKETAFFIFVFRGEREEMSSRRPATLLGEGEKERIQSLPSVTREPVPRSLGAVSTQQGKREGRNFSTAACEKETAASTISRKGGKKWCPEPGVLTIVHGGRGTCFFSLA